MVPGKFQLTCLVLHFVPLHILLKPCAKEQHYDKTILCYKTSLSSQLQKPSTPASSSDFSSNFCESLLICVLPCPFDVLVAQLILAPSLSSSQLKGPSKSSTSVWKISCSSSGSLREPVEAGIWPEGLADLHKKENIRKGLVEDPEGNSSMLSSRADEAAPEPDDFLRFSSSLSNMLLTRS